LFLLNCSEYNACVAVTVTTAQVENKCLKNGLLFHELLSSFGHLDGLSSTIRTGGQSIFVTDAHIRFERSTELNPKSPDLVENLLRSTFQEFELSRLPASPSELRSNPPSGWTRPMEQIVGRLLSFSDRREFSCH